MLESLALWPLMANAGWTKEQVDWLVGRAKQELDDLSLKLYMPLSVNPIRSPEVRADSMLTMSRHVVWGRKR